MLKKTNVILFLHMPRVTCGQQYKSASILQRLLLQIAATIHGGDFFFHLFLYQAGRVEYVKIKAIKSTVFTINMTVFAQSTMVFLQICLYLP